ncbi:MAG: RNA methyltransferase [Candidatus Nanopelagicales bacterium]|nr:RNA methyltransferase [Candidatus Nanopelagicales bacterium]
MSTPEPLLSARSARVRDARQLTVAKYRRVRGQFLAEGPQAVREAMAAGAVLEVLIDEDWLDRRTGIVAGARDAGVVVHVVDRVGFAGLVSAQSPQGVVAVCRWAPGTFESLIGIDGAGQVVLAHEMSDPGNAGALIRVADAAGAVGVALSERSVDATNPKCVRATAGSLFHLPVVDAGPTIEAIDALHGAGYRTLAADVTADSTDLFTAERAGLLAGRIAWVLGNEAHGLPEDVLAAVDVVVRIPILGRAESLNLATAAAVCLYAKARIPEPPSTPGPGRLPRQSSGPGTR